MTYKEKYIATSLFTNLLLFGFYFVTVFRMSQAGDLRQENAIILWGTIIVLAIIVNILSSILTQIVLSIIHYIRTHEEESYVEDERDELINLKGSRISYWVFSIGIFISMLSVVLGMSILVLFNLLILTAISAELVGDLSRLFLYRRGF